MTSTLIVCLTVVACVIYITWFIYFMAVNELPMFLWGQCVREEPERPKDPPQNPIGFAETSEPETTPEEKISDREAMEHLLQDTASTVSALLRGEVDFDDIKRD